MSKRDQTTDAVAAPGLLAPDEPAPLRIVNPEGRAPVLLVCDHASRFVPRALGGSLGLDEADLSRHIAYDIGISDVALALARRLDAPLVLSNFSRLVIDPNRTLGLPSSIPAESDGIAIPRNLELSDSEREARAASFFRPYHAAVARMIEAKLAMGAEPAFVSLHSFTPMIAGRQRPWQVGILWNRDPRLPAPLMEAFRARGLTVGDNEPYTGRDHHGYTIHYHAEPRGLVNALIELRQDLIDTPAGVAEMTDCVEGALGEAFAAAGVAAAA
jgi:predicted N-formylglutamate amidohydrolase